MNRVISWIFYPIPLGKIMNLTRDGLKDPVWDPDSCPPLTGSPAAPAEAQPSAAITVSPGQQQLEHMFQLARLHQTLLFCCRLLGTDQQQAGWKGRLVISVLAPKGPPLSPCLAYGSGGKGGSSWLGPRCCPLWRGLRGSVDWGWKGTHLSQDGDWALLSLVLLIWGGGGADLLALGVKLRSSRTNLPQSLLIERALFICFDTSAFSVLS